MKGDSVAVQSIVIASSVGLGDLVEHLGFSSATCQILNEYEARTNFMGYFAEISGLNLGSHSDQRPPKDIPRGCIEHLRLDLCIVRNPTRDIVKTVSRKFESDR